jgi:hypothetical protein
MRIAILASVLSLVYSKSAYVAVPNNVMFPTCFGFATDIQNMDLYPSPIESHTGFASCENWNDDAYKATIEWLKMTDISPRDYIANMVTTSDTDVNAVSTPDSIADYHSSDNIMYPWCFSMAVDLKNMDLYPSPIESHTGFASCENWSDKGYEATIAWLKKTGRTVREYTGY